MKISEAMTPNPRSVRSDATIRAAAEEMRTQNVGVLPVCDDNVLTGIITDRDIVVECIATDENPTECLVKDHMTANPVCISPDAEAEKGLQLMAQEQIRRLCVTDSGRLVGIVSLGDLAVQPLDANALASALTHISHRTWHLGHQKVHV